jgi:hypothetical protein
MQFSPRCRILVGIILTLSVSASAQQPVPFDPTNPGGTPAATKGTSAKADTAAGISGAKFMQVPIGIGSHCSSVVLQSTDREDHVAWVLPRVFIGVNRNKQKLFEVSPPVNPSDKYRLRFSLFIPNNINSVIESRAEDDSFYSHGCDFDAVTRELETQAKRRIEAEYQRLKPTMTLWEWATTSRKATPNYTLVPVLPYKIRVTVEGVGEAWIPAKDEGQNIDTTVLHTYGWDHDVTIPFPSVEAYNTFMRDFDASKNNIGVKVTASIYFAAARENGSIKCSAQTAELEQSLKANLVANPQVKLINPKLNPGGDPIIDMARVNLKAEMAKSSTAKTMKCDIQGGTSDAFNQMALDITKGALTDIVPNLLTISQAQQQMPGQLPPLSGGGFPPPLPGQGGIPCPPGVDPVTFQQNNPGQICEPLPGQEDNAPRLVKLSALMSSVKKVSDTKIDVALTAPPSNEVFTTFVHLIGRPENPNYKSFLVNSSLGPIKKETVKVDGKDVVRERTMANGRGYKTGIDLPTGRIIRIYPKYRSESTIEYRERWKWATWKDMIYYADKGVDFRVQNHSYRLGNGMWLWRSRGITERANSELEKRINGYMGEATYPLFTGSWYTRAFKIVTRPEFATRKAPVPFTEEMLYGEKLDGKDAAGFYLGFREVNKIFNLTQELKEAGIKGIFAKADKNEVTNEWFKATRNTDGDGRPFIEIEALQNLGELTLFNMDNHGCTVKGEPSRRIQQCQEDWITRIYVDYSQAYGALTSRTVGTETAKNDDLFSKDDRYLKTSDRFKAVLPTSKSALHIDIDIRNKVTGNDSIVLSAESQMGWNTPAANDAPAALPLGIPESTSPAVAIGAEKRMP